MPARTMDRDHCLAVLRQRAFLRCAGAVDRGQTVIDDDCVRQANGECLALWGPCIVSAKD